MSSSSRRKSRICRIWSDLSRRKQQLVTDEATLHNEARAILQLHPLIARDHRRRPSIKATNHARPLCRTGVTGHNGRPPIRPGAVSGGQ